MARYPFDTREETEAAAGAVAEILDAHGFTRMAADCRGDRREADLPRYAAIALEMTVHYRPDLTVQIRTKLRALGLV